MKVKEKKWQKGKVNLVAHYDRLRGYDRKVPFWKQWSQPYAKDTRWRNCEESRDFYPKLHSSHQKVHSFQFSELRKKQNTGPISHLPATYSSSAQTALLTAETSHLPLKEPSLFLPSVPSSLQIPPTLHSPLETPNKASVPLRGTNSQRCKWCSLGCATWRL